MPETENQRRASISSTPFQATSQSGHQLTLCMRQQLITTSVLIWNAIAKLKPQQNSYELYLKVVLQHWD